MFIGFAGPLFNLLFAFTAFVIIAMMGYTYYSAGTKVSMTHDIEEYKDVPSPAYEAGLRSGDSIISINGNTMSDVSDIVTYVSTHPDENIIVIVDRNGKHLS